MLSKLKLLWSFMKGNRLLYLGAITSIAVSTLFSFISPLIIRFTVDSVIGNTETADFSSMLPFLNFILDKRFIIENLWVIGVVLLVIIGFQGFFTYLKGKWAAIASESIAKKLRERLFDHLQKLPFSFHTSAQTGDLVQRCTSDVETIRRFLGMQLVEIGRALIMLGGVIPIMLYLNVKMTIVSMVLVPIIFAFGLIFFIKVKAAFQLSDEAEGELSTVLQENLTGVRVVKAFTRQEFEIEKFDDKNCKYRDKTYKLIKLLAYYWSISDFISLVQICLVLLFGTYWASKGEISLGTLVVFLTYEGSLLWPIRQMGRILTDMGKALVAITRIQEIFDNPKEDKFNGESLPQISKLEGNIEFENLSFSYKNNESILKNISFKIKAGETIAIIGPTGSGKTTLVNLLPRLYDYENGKIKIDGQELSKFDRKWLRNQIGIVLQEPFLFSKSIFENIKLGNITKTEI